MESTTRSPDAPTPDSTFDLLRNRRRIRVVALLADRDSPVSLDDLAAAVAAEESEERADATPAERTEAVAARLHHTHLPKLADAGLVAYDAESKTAVPTRIEALAALSTAERAGVE